MMMLLHDDAHMQHHLLRGDRPAAISQQQLMSKDKEDRMMGICMRAGKEKGVQRTILHFDIGVRQTCQRHGTQGLKELLELVAIP